MKNPNAGIIKGMLAGNQRAAQVMGENLDRVNSAKAWNTFAENMKKQAAYEQQQQQGAKLGEYFKTASEDPGIDPEMKMFSDISSLAINPITGGINTDIFNIAKIPATNYGRRIAAESAMQRLIASQGFQNQRQEDRQQFQYQQTLNNNLNKLMSDPTRKASMLSAAGLPTSVLSKQEQESLNQLERAYSMASPDQRKVIQPQLDYFRNKASGSGLSPGQERNALRTILSGGSLPKFGDTAVFSNQGHSVSASDLDFSQVDPSGISPYEDQQLEYSGQWPY